MLVLSYPKKNNILFLLAVIVASCLLAPTAAKAQAQSVTINPDGGNTMTDGLKITITDTSILVRRNGIDQYNLDASYPQHDRGLKTYVILQQQRGPNTVKTPIYLKACDISGVHGEGTATNPWKVATITKLNNTTGGTYNITTIYTYVNGDSYYLVDFYISAHQIHLDADENNGPYYMHLYFSEHTWMNGTDEAIGYRSQLQPWANDVYFFEEEIDPGMDLPQVVGVECESGICSDGFTNGHYFKVSGGFTSHKAGAPLGRDTKLTPGYRLESQINAVPQNMGVAVHKSLLLEPTSINWGKTVSQTKRFAIGFNKTDIEGLTSTDLADPPLVLSNYGQTPTIDSVDAMTTIELSSANSQGFEGEDTHVINGLTLKVSGGMFNVPQIAYLRVVTTGTGTGHAAPGTDYEERYTHVIIPAESYFTPVQIPLDNILINGDGIENPDKTFTVELLSTCSPYLVLGTVQSSTYTIVDDDEHKIFVEAAQPTLDEGQTMKVKVKMTGAPLATPVTVTLSKGGTSEAEDEDHSAIPTTVTIPAGLFEVEFDLEASPDLILEPAETLEINAVAVFGAETKTAADTIQIIDTTQNNPANKVIHFITQDITENIPATFTASLPAGVSTELPIEITMPALLSSGSVATASGDFATLFPATITIGAFSSTIDFTVTAKRDSIIEPDEVAYFDATSPTFTFVQGSFNVIDNPWNKQITIAFDNATVSEGGSVRAIITLPYATTAAIDVDLLLDASSEADGDDFAFEDTKATIASNNIDAEFYVDINSDLWLELDELLTVGGTYKDFTIVPASVTILDETKYEPGLCDFTLEAPGTQVQEGNSISIKVKLAAGVRSTQPIVVSLSQGGSSAAGIEASDYSIPASVTIDPGQNEATVLLTPLHDLVLEPLEALEITASANISGSSSSQSIMFDIEDATADDPDNKKIAVNTPLSVTEAGTLSVTFSLPAGVTTAEPIDINLVIAQTGAGYADGADFNSGVPPVLTIPAGGDHVTWTTIATADGVTEGTEHLMLQATSTGFTINDNNPVDVEVLDNTAVSPATTIVFTATPTTMREDDFAIEVTASLQAGTASSPITITLDKLPGSVADDNDFFVSPDDIIILAGDPSVTFYVIPNMDTELERTELLNLGGTAPGYNVQGVSLNIEDVTGLTPGNKQITLAPEAASVVENNTVTIWVSLPAGITTSEDLTIHLTPGAGTAGTLLASDYVLPATVTIPAGENLTSFVLEAKPDGVIEPDERLEIVATATIFDESITTTADVDIQDATGLNPANWIITVTGSATVTEGGDVTYTFSLPSGITSSNDIVINLTPGTATPAVTADDIDGGIPPQVIISAGSNSGSLLIETNDDNIIEATEKLELIPSSVDGYTFTGNVTLDVEDNDMTGAAILLTADANVTEGTSSTITATLQGGLIAGTDIVVTLSKATGSTAADEDHGTLTTITIPANNTSGSVSLTTALDDLLESPETVIIEGTATGFTITGATFTIDDKNGEDAANKILTITPEATSIAEGGSTKVWIRLPSPQKTQEPLTITLQKGSATSGTLDAGEYDFPPTVTIPAGGSEVSFDLDALTDDVIEPAEELEIAASAMVYGTSITASEKVDITDATSRLITITGPTSITEGSTGTITFSLPTNVTSTTAITINLTPGTATPAVTAVDIDGGIPTQVIIPAGSNETTLLIEANADGILESTEKLHLVPSATGFTFGSDVTVDIADNDHTGATIALSTSQTSIQEGTTGTTITATLQGGLTAGSAITITLNKATASTAADEDHGTLGTITIAAGGTSGSTTVAALDDDILERDETLILEGTATGFTITSTTVTITDATGPKAITLAPEASTVTEGHTIKVWVRLPTGITTSEDITVQLDHGTNTVAGTTEYTFPSSVIIPEGANGISFDVEAKTDDVIEGNELLEITAEATVFDVSADASASVNIIDATGTATNKVITITGPTSITEGSTGTITFSLPTNITTAEAITISLAPGTATPATGAADFDPALLMTVTIPAGGDHGELEVSAKTDALLEPTEKLHLVPSATGFTFGSDVTVDIADNDHTGATIALSTSQTSIQEGGTGTTITATLQGGLTAGSAITIILNKATASTAADEDHGTLGTITIAAGTTSGSTTIAALDDDILERDETLLLEGTATGFTITSTTVTITDATGPKAITLSPEASTVTEGHTIKVWVRLPSGITTSEDITVQLDHGTNTVAGTTEYTFPSSVIIPEGANGISFDVEAKTDDVIEGNELLEITAEATVFDVSADASTSVDIIDATGTAANKVITITGPTSITEGSNGTITFSLPTDITTAEAITITLAPGTATPATDAADFDPALLMTVTIPAGGDHGELEVSAKTDALLEPTEKLHLIPSATGFTFGSDVTVDIADNDHTGATIALSTSQTSIQEGATGTTITATLQGGLTAGSAITITLNKATASTAADEDHGTLGTIIIPAGGTSGSTTITALDDDILERDETLLLEGTATGFTITGTTVTITDATGPKAITLSPEASTVTEAHTIKVWVRLPTGITTSEDITVQLDHGTNTVAGTTEYTFPSSVIIPEGANGISFDVEAKTDDVIEGNELLEITAEATVFDVSADASTSVNIIDATGTTTNKVITISGPTSITEGSTGTITFSLPSGITSSNDIVINLTPGTATPAVTADDIDGGIPPQVIIPAGSNSGSLLIETTDDNIIEATEKLELIPSSVDGYTFTGNVTLDVEDNDMTGAAILLTADANVTEGTSSTITATLQGGLIAGTDIVVTLSKATGSTAADEDHGTLTTITIPANNTSGSVSLTTALDDLLESPESVIIEGTATGFTITGATFTIDDKNGEDAANKILTITPEATSIAEGGSTKVWIRLPSPQKTQEPLTITLQKGSATSGTLDTGEYDFPPTVTIPAGGSEVSFDLDALTDDVIEPAEELEIAASAMVYGTSITASEKVDITDATSRLITITGPTSITEGSTGTITFSLPTNVTSTTAIIINLTPGATIPAVTAGDIDGGIPTQVTILAGSNSGSLLIEANADGILESTEKLHLIASATGFTFGSDVTVDIADNDHTGATIALSTSQTSIQEGTTGTTITATLQGGLTAGSAITITLNKATASTAADEDHGTLGTIIIPAGSTSGSTTITALDDDILERDETLILEGTATGFTITGTTVTITDATGPKAITLSPEASTVTEGHTIKVWVRLPTGITTSEDITVQLDHGTNTVAGTTEYAFPSSVIIPEGANGISFDVEAKEDDVIEANELLEITAEATVFDVSADASTSVDIIDATGTATNKVITISGPTSITEGSTGTITFSLPTNITSTTAITIHLTPGTATPAVTSDDINGGIPTQVTIPAGSNSATLLIDVNTDATIEPAEILHLLPSAAGFTFNGNVRVDIFDQNHSGTIAITSNHATIREADATATIKVSLPGALLAGGDILVNISKGATSTAAATDHSVLPASVTIKAGEHDASFTITAPADNILEATESLVIEGSAAGYSVSATTLQVEDATSLDPANTLITLVAASSILEGSTAQFFVSLPAGIVSSTPIQVNMAKTAATSTAADTDHTQIPADITIPAMTNRSVDFNISAVTDGIIEPQETLQVDGTVPAGLTFASTQIHIDDATGLNPANRLITMAIDSSILHEGSSSNVTFALPAGITTATDILIAVTADAAFSADYTLTPATVLIAAGNNKTDVTLEAVQDNTGEATEELNFTATATGFTITPGQTVTIPGDAAPVLTVTAHKTMDAAEPSTQGAFTLQLNNSAIAPADITIQYSIAGSATAGTDYTALSGQAIIKSGENSITIPVTVANDQLAEGTETVQLSLQSASYLFLGTPATCAVNNSSVTMNIADNPGYDKSIRIEKIADAAEPNTSGRIRIRFNSSITAVAPVAVTYDVTGTATAGTDYTALSGTAVIPAGEQEVVLPVIPQDDNIREGDETIIIRLTGASSTIPGVTWTLAAQQEATVNLADNDVVTMEVFAPEQVAEGAALQVTLRASQLSPVDIPVTVTLQHDATRTVNPTVPQSGTTLTVTLPANQSEISFSINLEDNETNDDDGFVNLLIEPQPGGGQPYGKGTSGNTATRITDNDPLQITFKKDTVRVMEGLAGTTPMPFTVVLSRKSTRAITLNYEFGDAFEGAGADRNPQRANPGEDYHALITSIVIPPLQDEVDIVVPAFGDVGAEEDEYFALKLKSAAVTSGQNIPVMGTRSVAIGGIMNDDMAIDMEIRVSKALSPNGDGKNDVLIIENIEKYARNEIVILNRWGGSIYKTSNYNNQSNNFKGRSNAGGGTGNDLTDGSYFYILHVWDGNGKMQRHTGYIVLKKAN